MKNCLLLFINLTAFSASLASAENPVTPRQLEDAVRRGVTAGMTPPAPVQNTGPKPEDILAAQARLTKFDLDFQGGTPIELVAAIQKAMGRPLNAIIPVEYANRRLPPLKMRRVNVAELFRALDPASRVREIRPYVNGQFTTTESNYGFRTVDNPVTQTDDTVWYFYVSGEQPRGGNVSKYYLLSPYLEAGLTVDDITTAIQTGWRLRGDTTTPAISFHKETKLLIAVGDPNGLEVIDLVLKALDSVRPKTTGNLPAADPKSKP